MAVRMYITAFAKTVKGGKGKYSLQRRCLLLRYKACQHFEGNNRRIAEVTEHQAPEEGIYGGVELVVSCNHEAHV